MKDERSAGRGVALIASVLAALVAIFVVLASWFLARASLPALGAAANDRIDRAIALNVWVTGLVFVACHVVLLVLLLRRSQPLHPISERVDVERAWVICVAIPLVFLLVRSERDVRALATVTGSTGRAGPPLDVEVVGQQFAWNFRLPGDDALLGRTQARLVDQGELNFIGLDRADPASEDDIVLPQGVLIIPRNKHIRLRLKSMDVIHSFFVPGFRIKRDAVPGLETVVDFVATELGEFEVACAEHCGLGHYRMRAVIHVVDEAEYASKLKEATQ